MPCVLQQKRADKATQASTFFSTACPTCLFQFKTMQVIEQDKAIYQILLGSFKRKAFHKKC